MDNSRLQQLTTKERKSADLLYEELLEVLILSRYIFRIEIEHHGNRVIKRTPLTGTPEIVTVYETAETHLADKLSLIPFRLWCQYKGCAVESEEAVEVRKQLRHFFPMTDWVVGREEAAFLNELCVQMILQPRTEDTVGRPHKDALAIIDKYLIKYFVDREKCNAYFAAAGKPIPFEEDSTKLRNYLVKWLRRMSRYAETETHNKRMQIYIKSYSVLQKNAKER